MKEGYTTNSRHLRMYFLNLEVKGLIHMFNVVEHRKSENDSHYSSNTSEPFHSQVQKSTFFQLSKNKCTGEAVRIGSIIIFHLSKLWKAKFLTSYCVM